MEMENDDIAKNAKESNGKEEAQQIENIKEGTHVAKNDKNIFDVAWNQERIKTEIANKYVKNRNDTKTKEKDHNDAVFEEG